MPCRTKPRRTRSYRAASGLLIALAALVVLACGPTQSSDTVNDGGVIAPAVERPADLDRFLQLPEDVDYVDFPWSEVEVDRSTGTLTVGVLVADTSERRSRGMMYRNGLPEQSGMIFIWEDIRAQTGGFWNPNVPIDLDVAWLDANGSIMEFTVLTAGDSTIKGPAKPYYFVMEMPRGRFAALGIELGDRVVIPITLLPR
ncbi:MAG: DUF192 domain-containing protein [Chloroflexi bacterium]|nr:DUF192 domain-containing protein [Chloroflexota bacterium]